MDISRYIEGGTRLSAEELRPGLSAITFQADIYMCVCVSRSIERVDSIQEIDVRFEQATTSSRLPKGRGGGRIGDRVVYDALCFFYFFVIVEGRGSEGSNSGYQRKRRGGSISE